jgi:hypothetical protein
VKDPVITYKIPFTFNKTDLFNASKPYVVLIAGMGPFFSGIFISSVLIFIYWYWRARKPKEAIPIIIVSSTLMISVLVISESWYVRYVPQLWFIPLILLMTTERYAGYAMKTFRNILYLIMLINISFCLASFPFVYYRTLKIKYELDQLKASKQTIPVEFTYFTSNRARFRELDIPFREVSIPDSQAVFMSGSSTKMIPPAVMPDLPKPWILREGDKITERYHLKLE